MSESLHEYDFPLQPLPSVEESEFFRTEPRQAHMEAVAAGVRAIRALTGALLEDKGLVVQTAVQMALTYEVGRADRELAQLKEDEANMRDHLTGLYTRKMLDLTYDGLAHEGEGYRFGSAETRTNHSLLLLDIDHFKRINDTHGHMEGDRVLKAVSDTIVGALRRRDVVVRYGGEEIAIVLPRASMGNAVHVADGLREKLKNPADPSVAVSASIGVTELDFEYSLEDNLRRADQALYYAKEHGRDMTVRSDEPDIDTNV